MSPERPTSRGSSGSKPYTRTPSTEDSKNIAKAEYPQTPDMDELDGIPGFPTRAQYQIIERGYIESLTPRRQGKALISQALFDRIWDVLHSADNAKENAQFRFWARKMFTLSRSHTVSLGLSGSRTMEQEVLLHDGLLVAVREQIYDLLCYCHGSTNHGGRDKTCALIRKHYTWVPKDLVAQFIKACPTCVIKKCGHADTGLLSPRLGTTVPSPTILAVQPPAEDYMKQEPASPVLSFKDYFNDVDGLDVSNQDTSNSLPSTPIHATHSQFTFSSDQSNGTPIDQLIRYNQLSSNSSSYGFPMMREVSLFKGIPDGWQYQNVDYRNAHAECIEYQRIAPIMPYDPSLGRTRPRVPDVAPLFKPNFEDIINFKTEETECILEPEDDRLAHTFSMSPQEVFNVQALSPTLGSGDTIFPIDPFLLALSASMHSPSLGFESPISRSIHMSRVLNAESDSDIPSPSSAPLSSSPCPDNDDDDVGLAGTPGLRLEGLDSVKTFRDFITIRENLNSGLTSPEDETKDDDRLWKRGRGESGNSSPTSSLGSDASGLSLVSGTGTGSPTSIISTPMTTAPVSPVEEVLGEKDGIRMGRVDPAGEGEDLSAVIQAVSACGVEA